MATSLATVSMSRLGLKASPKPDIHSHDQSRPTAAVPACTMDFGCSFAAPWSELPKPEEHGNWQVELVFETRAATEDNEKGIASGGLQGRLSEKAALWRPSLVCVTVEMDVGSFPSKMPSCQNSRSAWLSWSPALCRSLHGAAQHRCRADTQSILRIGLQHILSRLCSDLLAQRFIAREH
jgi:hypothetical protein